MIQQLSTSTEVVYSTTRYKTSEGLSSNCITAVFQDSKGFLWIGTEDGLNRFDGKNFKIFRSIIDDDTSISGNYIISITEDNEGNIWIADKRGGLSKLNIEMGIIVSYKANNEGYMQLPEIFPDVFKNEMSSNSLIQNKLIEKNIIFSDEITSIIEDNSGILWIGTKYNGLVKILEIIPNFQSFNKNDKKSPLPKLNITAIYTTYDVEIWAGSGGNGLYLIDIESGEINNFILDKKNHLTENDYVYSILKDDNFLIIGSNSGVYALNISTKKIKKIDDNFNEKVYDIIKDQNGTIWFATDLGLYKYDSETIELFFKDKNGITSLSENNEEDLWIGNSEGLKYLNKERNRVILPHGIGFFEVMSLSNTKEGNILVGTTSGLFNIHKDSLDYKIIPVKEFPNKKVMASITDNNNQLWILSGNGINFIDKSGILRENFNLYDGFEGCTFNHNAIFKSPSGKIYFGSKGNLCWTIPDSIKFNKNIPEIAITDIELCIKNNCLPVYLDENKTLNLQHKFGMTLKINFAALEYTNPAANKFKVFVQKYDSDWRPDSNQNFIELTNLRPGKYKLKILGSNNDNIWNNNVLEIPIIVKAPIGRTWFAYLFYFVVFIFIIQLIINLRIMYYKNINQSLIDKNRDKSILEAQKEELSIMNKNLTDSINYATRIQSAVIPTERKIRNIFPQSFVYFNPRDNVSGDFYWVSEVENKVFLAAVDCTGHGVPGAFLSIIGMNLLRSIIENQKEDNPARILEKLSYELQYTLRNDDSEDAIKDGMDVAICVIDREKAIMHYAGAVNDLYLIRNRELIVYKGDRNPIGYSVDGIVPQYASNSFQIEENDVFFIFSDGYADQFGGPELKKFKYRKFRYLLLNIHRFSPDDQKAALSQSFEGWKGTNDQVDDVLVMGFCPFKNGDF